MSEVGYGIVDGATLHMYWPDGNTWTARLTVGGSGYHGVGAVIDNVIYYGIGYEGITYYSSWSKYTHAINTKVVLTDFLGGGRTNAIAFAIGRNIYVGLGSQGSGSYLADMYAFNVDTETWSALANFSGHGRRGATGWGDGNYGYVLGGWWYSGGDYYYLKDFWRYEAGVGWTQLTDFPIDIRSGVAFVINGVSYAGTGLVDSTYTKNFYKYDTSVPGWVAVTDFGGTARAGASAFAAGGKGYVFWGLDGVGNSDECWEYNPSLDTWTQKADTAGATYSNLGVGPVAPWTSVYPSEAITRVTALVHRYHRARGIYTLEMSLGDITSDYGVPAWAGPETARQPKPEPPEEKPIYRIPPSWFEGFVPPEVKEVQKIYPGLMGTGLMITGEKQPFIPEKVTEFFSSVWGKIISWF